LTAGSGLARVCEPRTRHSARWTGDPCDRVLDHASPGRL